MLCSKRDEVMYGGVVVPLDVCANELPTLRESNCVEASLELSYACNLFGNEVDLVIHVSVLQYFDERNGDS